MRVSTYEMFYPLIGADEREIEGKMLLFNGLYCALDVVDAQQGEKLREGKLDELPFALRERLAARGHITWKDEAGELADAELLGAIASKTYGRSSVGAVILPTYNCNFRCPYCFERHRLTRGEEWLGSTMTPGMVEAVFAALKNYRERGYRVDGITLYGGEPLMKENMAVVRDICQHAREMDISINAITNGYDLEEYLDLLEEFKVKSLQITVDGVGELNDGRRRHRDGVPTYDRIMENVGLAVERGINVSLRVNVNGDNIHGIRALKEDIAARGLKESTAEEAVGHGEQQEGIKGKFHYYFKAVSEPVDSPTHVSERQVLDAIMEAGFSVKEAIERQSQYDGHAQELESVMEKERFYGYSNAFCGSERGMAVIAPDGRIYPCWDMVAMEEEAVGAVDEDSGRFLYGFRVAKWRTRTSDLMEPCRTCPLIFTCRGGCASQARREHGSCFRENCGEAKEILSFVVSRVAGRKWEKSHEEELSVSMLPPVLRLTEADRRTIMTTRSPQKIAEILAKAGIPLGEGKKEEKIED